MSVLDRMMLTTKTSPPFFLETGFIDECIRIVIESGVEPAIAYRMASLNPAVYYGLDHEIGGICSRKNSGYCFSRRYTQSFPHKSNGQRFYGGS